MRSFLSSSSVALTRPNCSQWRSTVILSTCGAQTCTSPCTLCCLSMHFCSVTIFDLLFLVLLSCWFLLRLLPWIIIYFPCSCVLQWDQNVRGYSELSGFTTENLWNLTRPWYSMTSLLVSEIFTVRHAHKQWWMIMMTYPLTRLDCGFVWNEETGKMWLKVNSSTAQ